MGGRASTGRPSGRWARSARCVFPAHVQHLLLLVLLQREWSRELIHGRPLCQEMTLVGGREVLMCIDEDGQTCLHIATGLLPSPLSLSRYLSLPHSPPPPLPLSQFASPPHTHTHTPSRCRSLALSHTHSLSPSAARCLGDASKDMIVTGGRDLLLIQDPDGQTCLHLAAQQGLTLNPEP